MQDCFCVSLVCGATLVYRLRLFKPNELIKRLCDDVGLALGHVFGVSHIAALRTTAKKVVPSRSDSFQPGGTTIAALLLVPHQA
jgi:hypothetical protein